jgi:hypothetical protein
VSRLYTLLNKQCVFTVLRYIDIYRDRKGNKMLKRQVRYLITGVEYTVHQNDNITTEQNK